MVRLLFFTPLPLPSVLVRRARSSAGVSYFFVPVHEKVVAPVSTASSMRPTRFFSEQLPTAALSQVVHDQATQSPREEHELSQCAADGDGSGSPSENPRLRPQVTLWELVSWAAGQISAQCPPPVLPVGQADRGVPAQLQLVASLTIATPPASGAFRKHWAAGKSRGRLVWLVGVFTFSFRHPSCRTERVRIYAGKHTRALHAHKERQRSSTHVYPRHHDECAAQLVVLAKRAALRLVGDLHHRWSTIEVKRRIVHPGAAHYVATLRCCCGALR